MQRSRPLRVPSLIILSGALFGCLDAPDREAARLPRAMTAEFAARLDGDAEAFRAYARDGGAAVLKQALVGLEISIDASSMEG